MSVSETAPTHIIVGVDVGMTGTGVAIGSYSKNSILGPQIIQRWTPDPNRVDNKIPTQVTYRAATAAHVHSVGFECPSQEKIGTGMRLIGMFKFHLDDNFLRERHKNSQTTNTDTLDDVKFWYQTFLTALHGHISRQLQDIWKVDITLTRVEYIFSLPTSWQTNDILRKRFREIIHDSGFGNDVTMELTEGEAAAVFTAKHHSREFTEGDAFIVCDSGGGTTDMCVLRVKQLSGEAVELENVDEPKGVYSTLSFQLIELHSYTLASLVLPVGSVNIDELFEEKIQGPLAELRRIHPELSEHVAHQITRDEFQKTKKSIGTGLSLPIWKFQVPDPVTNERIEVSKEDIQAMFDKQIHQIFEFIDSEVTYLEARRPDVHLSYLVLAGGLCSSEYVQAKIKRHYEKNITVLFAGAPLDLPLAVCRGLVIDRLQHLSNQISVISIPSGSASYGILHWKTHNSKEETGQDPTKTTKSPVDGNKYTPDQIDWLIVRGQQFESGEDIRRKYSRLLTPKNQTHRWKFAVVRSTLLPTMLPNEFAPNNGDATIYCLVIADLEPGPENIGDVRRRWLRGKTGVQVDYEISAIIKPGELKFRARIVGQKESEVRDLEVKWLDDLAIGAGECNVGFDDGLIKFIR
ncbi:uncharacterized protein BP5553_02943 [Venustampulla echinocandica]|uniref:Actin-like ATPase domain-containing protein n=1 Tax=Venustampulla echinocandica TaxID=2656787 RepID=A0A370TSX5_9HELO|nr:uncharacterized protein BP5553_02943 [Venustampulla echinocandica]RDL38603.1 hypothetical protein BP5553_02943 [Venustampulla echinocandica]